MLACVLRQHDKDLYERRVTAHLESSPLRTLHPEQASLFVHPACLVDAYFRIRDGHVAGYWRAWRAIEALVLADIAALGFSHMPHAVFMLRCPGTARNTRYWVGRRAFPQLWWSGRFLAMGCLEAPVTVNASRALHMPYCDPEQGQMQPRPGVDPTVERPAIRDIRVLFIGSESGWGWSRRAALDLANATSGNHWLEIIPRTSGLSLVHSNFVSQEARLKQLMRRAVYTLCPRGDTTESSRIYQAFRHGSIPLVEPFFHGPLHAGNWSEFSWPIQPAQWKRLGKPGGRSIPVPAAGLALPSAEQEVRLQSQLARAAAAFDCTPGSEAMARFLNDAVGRLDLHQPAAPVMPPSTHARIRLFEPCRKLFTQSSCGVDSTDPQSCMDCLLPAEGHRECRCVVNDTVTLATWGTYPPES